MADTKMSEKLWRDCKSDQERADFILCGRAHETGVIAKSIQSEVAMAFQRLATLQTTPPADAPTIREINEREDYQREHGEYPPADAALAEYCERAARNWTKGCDMYIGLMCAAAALRARPQAVPQHINAVYFDVPAQPRSAYVMGWNDCIDSLLAASQSATGGAT